MTAYYNEFDPKAAAWLRELIRCGLIADGVVDERSILDVSPADLAGFTQCHFFAGIGGWSYALRLAGWPDDRPVWTGSPPCQPFSSAGRQLGRDDERHLGPHLVGLVRACRPAVLFGEQVASAAVFGPAAKGNRPGFDGTPPWAWVDDLFDRLEAARYAAWASDIPSAGVGAPHIRQRTFFGAVDLERLADAACQQHNGAGGGRTGRWPEHSDRCTTGGLADADGGEPRKAGAIQPGGQHGQQQKNGRTGRLADADNAGSQGCDGELNDPGGRQNPPRYSGPLCDADRLEHAPRDGRDEWRAGTDGRGLAAGCVAGGVDDTLRAGRPLAGRHEVPAGERQADDASCGSQDDRWRVGAATAHAPDSPWGTPDWLFCRDGRWRPVESGTFPLAHGVSARVGRLRGYGNAINPWCAKEFIEASCATLSAERFRLTETSGMTTDNTGVFG